MGEGDGGNISASSVVQSHDLIIIATGFYICRFKGQNIAGIDLYQGIVLQLDSHPVVAIAIRGSIHV